MRNTLLLLLTTFFLAACGSTRNARTEDLKDVMDSWIGRHKADLIQAWGPPNRYASDGRDGEVLVYERTVKYGEVVERGGYHERILHPYRMFFADAYGNIYFWRAGDQ